MRKKILGTSAGIAFALLAITSTANATLITSGEITVLTPSTGRGEFSFSVGGTSLFGHHDEGPTLLSGAEGTLFDGSQVLGVGAIEFFYGFINSQFVTWNTHLGGSNPTPTQWSITTAGALLTQGQTVYQSAFQFSGALCATYVSNTPCDQVFSGLTGQGIAEFIFDESVLGDGTHFFKPTKATYRFASVPEPAPLALFGIGLLAIGLAKRRRGSTG